MSSGGKGSKQRPTDKKKFDDNWDLIFGKKTNEVIIKSADGSTNYISGENWLRDAMREEDKK
jgi:hypothetical protein